MWVNHASSIGTLIGARMERKEIVSESLNQRTKIGMSERSWARR